jgi:tRNA(His) 5'-end guanylyltransferase
MNDNFGDRMKLYEMSEAGRKLMPLLPVIARLDGRSFHGFVRGLERPYDRRLSNLMVETTKYLVSETNACCGYTQSDEITLGWYEPEFGSQLLFDGRVSKTTSILAALCSVFFNKRLPDFLSDEYAEKMPIFDCRVWCVPNVAEGANAFLWREHDATKNSISMAARHYYSHNELDHKSGPEMQEMLWRKGVNWNDYPTFFKRGTFVQRKKVVRPFTTEEMDKLPPRHEARINPNLLVERTEYVVLDMPPFGKIANRAEVIFFGAEPRVASEVRESTQGDCKST